MAAAHAGLELDPSFPLLYQPVGWASVAAGRYNEAVEAYRKQARAADHDNLAQAHLGWALGLAGHREEARSVLNELKQRRSQAYAAGSLLAWVCIGLNDHDQAMSWLQEGAEERDGLMFELNQAIFFDPLRSDPRFQALLQRMHFPQ